MADLQKLASQVPAILSESSNHLRKMAAHNAELIDQRDTALHELRLMKIARRMEMRGLEPNRDFEEKVAALRSVDPGRLDAMEQAVELSVGGFKLGSLEVPDSEQKVEGGPGGELPSSSSYQALDSFIVSGSALG